MHQLLLYIEAARKKSSLGVGVLAWAAYNRYHLTLFLYICVFFLLEHVTMRSLGVACVVSRRSHAVCLVGEERCAMWRKKSSVVHWIELMGE